MAAETNQKHVDAPATFEDRVLYHRRILARGVGKSPPALLRRALDHAAFCAADAERVRLNPSIPCTDRIAIFREALAERKLNELKKNREDKPWSPTPLVDLRA